MEVREITVPEGTQSYVTVVVRCLATGDVFPTNIALSADLQIGETFSEKLKEFDSSILMFAPDVASIPKYLREEGDGYVLVIEDGDDNLATNVFPDDIQEIIDIIELEQAEEELEGDEE